MTAAQLTARLAHISHDIEAHEAALWRLRDEQLTLRQELRTLNWQAAPPAREAAA